MAGPHEDVLLNFELARACAIADQPRVELIKDYSRHFPIHGDPQERSTLLILDDIHKLVQSRPILHGHKVRHIRLDPDPSKVHPDALAADQNDPAADDNQVGDPAADPEDPIDPPIDNLDHEVLAGLDPLDLDIRDVVVLLEHPVYQEPLHHGP